MQKTVYKIRRNLVLSIMLAVLAVFGIFVFAACSDDLTVDDIKKDFPVEVTYDFQGGTVNNRGNANVLVKENSKLPAPRNGVGGVGIPLKSGYSFKGFYVAKTDENGVVRDEHGDIVVTDKEWDFEHDKVSDQDITLCAKYWDNYIVVLHYGENYGETLKIDLPRNIDGTPTDLSSTSLLVSNYTFFSYNLVKDSTDKDTALENDISYQIPADKFSDDLTLDVWGKSMEGTFVVVRTADDLTISTVGETTNYWLMADIDMGGAVYNDAESDNKIPKSYSGKFIGNGHSISNFTMNLATNSIEYSDFGLFRSLDSNAEITDVTFKDFTLSCSISNASVHSYHVGLLAGQISAGAKIKDVKFERSENATKNSTFEYMLGVGVDRNSVTVAADILVGQKDSSVVLQGDCSVSGTDVVASTAVFTADDQYALYVKYTEKDGVISLGKDAIYAFAEKNKNGVYAPKNIDSVDYVGENKYVLTRISGAVYDVLFLVNNGRLYVTLTERS